MSATTFPAKLSESHKRPNIWTMADPRTLDELAVLTASVEAREQDNWRTDALSAEGIARLREEATKKHRFSDSMAQYFEDELKYEAGRWHDEARGIESTGVPAVVRSDKAVPEDVLDKLRALSNELENTPKKDWHPESDNTILDVVHPAMYCLVDDQTRVLKEDEEVHFPEDNRDLGRWFSQVAEIYPAKKEQQRDPHTTTASQPLNHTHQWLPADFSVDEDGNVKTLSYVNNLHTDPSKPSGQLYDVVERALEGLLPMFEASLAEFQLPGFRKEFRKGNAESHWLLESWKPPAPAELSVEDLASSAEDRQYLRTDGTAQWDKSANRIEAARKEYWTENREWVRVPVEKFEPQTIEPISLKGRQLQLIVKLATIHLNAEKPEFEGGAWHVEGTFREKICASGNIYFDEENIQDSKIGFRNAIDTAKAKADLPYEQHDFDAIMEFYGFGTDTETSQELGTLSTKRGRSLVHSNGLQHQVPSFKLADATKSGHRKVLAFFLVDPLEKVISTARVPPQQYSWMQQYYTSVFLSMPPRVPNEVRRMILEYTAPAAIVPRKTERTEAESQRKKARLASDKEPRCGMSLEEARAARMTLMRERAVQAVVIEEVNELGFGFFEQ
ncbi:hypothetical protein OC842_001492 [Tilletia horrida]|uniref:DUF4246 domain-containing protein n=1 Tax=Tilletia horrida TaxID=155126 RepID=A0AAN6JND4_9BASI|nr:hypothetical protein OC842_001492 [Tilletia horrida]